MSLYQGEDARLSVTTSSNGSRTFMGHDVRWDSKQSNRRRGRQKNWRGNHGGQGRLDNRGSYYSRGRGSRGAYSNQPGGYNRPGPYSRPPKVDLDDDFSMKETGGSGRHNPYRPQSRRGRPRSLDKLKRLGVPFNSHYNSEWFQIMIPYGKMYEKADLLKLLSDDMPTPFMPVQFRYEDKEATFLVRGHQTANALRDLSHKFELPGGRKMAILVRSTAPPTLPEESLSKLQDSMSKRYDPITHSLNLSAMHKDEALNKEGYFLALNKSQNMEQVIKVIEEHIPELARLDLSNNKLLSLGHLTNLVAKTRGLVRLNLSNNQLRSMEELDRIKGWQLQELILEGNDLCDKFTSQAAYISAIRDKFPKVVKLDGRDLPPPVTFEVETDSTLPTVQGSYFVNQEIQNIVVKFLKEYFTVYDSDNRQGLIDAYHEQAFFSTSVAYSPVGEHSQAKLSEYMSESRNLLKKSAKEVEMRGSLIHHGHVAVVNLLCLLPKSTHDPTTMVVDVNFASQTLLSFTVTGVFKETESRVDKPPIRTFSRVMTAVPRGAGMVITNDMLTITNASPEKMRSAFKITGPTPSSSPVLATPQPPLTGGLTPEQHQLIAAFVQHSGMNQEWSAKCLEENNWDFEKSGQIFTVLQREGKIPPEAFVK